MKLNRTIITYFLIAIGAFVFNKVYALFGHGVTSTWMSRTTFYLLGLGVLVFLLLRILVPDIVNRKGYRLFYNTYNSGIAVLINGMLLHGILDIAGGTSQFISWFLYIGWGLIALSFVLFIRIKSVEAKLVHR